MCIVIKLTKIHGLEVWQLYVNGTYFTEFMSETYALRKARALMDKYNATLKQEAVA